MMKTRLCFVCLYLLTGILFQPRFLFGDARPGTPQDRPLYAADRIKIKLAPDAISRAALPTGLYATALSFGINELDQIYSRNGGRQIIRAHRRVRDTAWESRTGFDRWFVIKLDGKTSVEEAINSFKSNRYIEAAEPEYIAYTTAVPNDTYYANNWGHNNVPQFHAWNSSTYQYTGPIVGIAGFDTDAQLAWDQGYGDPDIVIAIIDTGVDSTHPDLNQVAGYDYGSGDSNPHDDSADPGHGTLCAGVTAGIANNGIGVAGIAGGCRIMPLKVAANDGSLGFTAIANAITHAADHGADVISMSLGGSGSSDPTVDPAIAYAYNQGVVVFAATGNYYDPAYMGSGVNEIQDEVSYPANNQYVISVGAASPGAERKSYTSVDNVVYWGSCYGVNTQDDRMSVDIMAPSLLPSTDIQGTAGWNTTTTNNNYYWYFGGTSCATPYAAGCAALLLSANPTLSPAQIRTALTGTATDMTIDGGLGWDMYTGYGMINVYAALSSLQNPPQIAVLPAALDQTQAPGQIGAQNLTIGNTGEMTLNYTLSKQLVTNTILNEGFENGGIIPSGWTQQLVSQNQYWVFATGGYNSLIPSTAHSGTYNARLFYANKNTPRITKLITPSMNLTGAISPVLKFWHTQAANGTDQDQLKIYYKTSSGGTWIQLAYYTSSIAAWTLETIALPNPSSTYYIAFEGITDYSYGVCVDDVSVSDSYYSPAWLQVAGANYVSGSVDGLARDLDTIELSLNSSGLAVGTYTTNLLLTSNSLNNSSLQIPVTLNVQYPPAQTVTFAESFENTGHNWLSADLNQTNKWARGIGAKNIGDYGYYISNNSGTSNAYTTSVASVSHLYRDISFPAGTGNFVLRFNWKGMGELNTDYLKVFLVDTSVNPIGGASLTSGQIGTLYQQQSTWQEATIDLGTGLNGLNKRLVFTWVNNASAGSNPPIALDDIRIVSGSQSDAAVVLGTTVNIAPPDVTDPNSNLINPSLQITNLSGSPAFVIVTSGYASQSAPYSNAGLDFLLEGASFGGATLNFTHNLGFIPYQLTYKIGDSGSWNVVNKELSWTSTAASWIVPASKAATDLRVAFSNSSDGTLPVELSSFNALLISGNRVRLDWVTATETGVLGYNIYRHTQDALDTAELISSLIEGTNTSTEQHYSFTDSETETGTEYYYWLQGLDIDGWSAYYGPVSILAGNNDTNPPAVPVVTELRGNFPNPFNPSTTIRYALAKAGAVEITIYNSRGQELRGFAKTHSAPGFYSFVFDGRDEHGISLASGVYICKMRCLGEEYYLRMMLAK